MGLPTKTLGPQPPGALSGLSSAEAQRRLQQVGPNQAEGLPDPSARQLAAGLWNPAAGLLVLAIVAALALGEAATAAVIGLALAVQALSTTLQHIHSQKIMETIRQRLSPTARVLRDGVWQSISSTELVPGDLVSLRAGDRAPADLCLLSGQVMLAAPAAPGEIHAGGTIYAGALIHDGEASGEVVATGARTAAGETFDAIHLNRDAGRLRQLARRAMRNMAWLDGILGGVALAVLAAGRAPGAFLPFALILLLASLPAALAQVFNQAAAQGIEALGEQGALATRLSALDDTAGMQVVCADKNGLLTENQPTVGRVRAYAPYGEADVLHLAAMASDEAGQDPVDLALLARARVQGLPQKMIQRHWITPTDPARRHAEAVYAEDGDDLHVIKGTPAAVLGLIGAIPEEAHADIHALALMGNRVIAVAVGTGIDPPHLAGLVALQNAPRGDAAALVGRLHELGVKLVMLSGETRQAAQAVARQVGLRGEIHGGTGTVDPIAGDAYAELLPEDKIFLVRAYQQAGYRVGVTGVSLTDTPALRLADVGIAAAGASDAARSAAGLVLAQEGLAGLVAAIEASRQVTQRMLAATLHKLATAGALALSLTLGLLLTGGLVISPLLAALLLASNDFVSLALSADAGPGARQPEPWSMASLLRDAVSLGLPLLVLALGGLWLGQGALGLTLNQVHTLLFVLLAFGGQVTLYLARKQRGRWPEKWLAIASGLDIVAIAGMAGLGILMSALPLGIILGALAVNLVWLGAAGWIEAQI